jgi:cell volume regulation protein A
MSQVAFSVAAIGLILLLGVLLKLLSERRGYPLTLFLLLLGIIVGPVLGWFKPAESLTSVSSFITLALILVLFDAGMGMDLKKISKSFAAPFAYGTITAILTVIFVAVIFKLLLGLEWVFALLLGSLLASTDLTIISPIFRNLKVRPKLREYIEIESSVNSILAAVMVVVLINFINTGTQLSFSINVLSEGIQTLLYNIFVGAGLGVMLGYAILKFIKRLTMGEMPHIVMFGALFFTYALSEILGASGIATALAVGIVFGNSRLKVPSIIKSFGGEMELILVTFVYVILGAIISFEVMKTAILPAILLIGVVYLARFVATKYFASQFQQYNKFLVLSSPRGITCAVLTLNYANLFPNPELIIGLVFSVVLVSSFSMFALPKTLAVK